MVRHYDTEFTPEIEKAWRATLGLGVVYRQGGYQSVSHRKSRWFRTPFARFRALSFRFVCF